jgi:WD40 repeat protein
MQVLLRITEKEEAKKSRQWGARAVVPTQPLYTIQAHKNDAICVRYDGSNLNLVTTASSDSTVRVWDTSNGQLQATFSGGGSHPMLGVDISNGIICGCGADKTCQVWRYDTKRMIHQLAGHSQKVTCISLFPGEKSVLTASADRSIKIWDISRNTYRFVNSSLCFVDYDLIC